MKTQFVTVRLTDEQQERLDELARLLGTNHSQVMRALLDCARIEATITPARPIITQTPRVTLEIPHS